MIKKTFESELVFGMNPFHDTHKLTNVRAKSLGRGRNFCPSLPASNHEHRLQLVLAVILLQPKHSPNPVMIPSCFPYQLCLSQISKTKLFLAFFFFFSTLLVKQFPVLVVGIDTSGKLSWDKVEEMWIRSARQLKGINPKTCSYSRSLYKAVARLWL